MLRDIHFRAGRYTWGEATLCRFLFVQKFSCGRNDAVVLLIWGPILSPWLGDTVGYGDELCCRTGPSAYVAWKAGSTTRRHIAGFIPQSETKNTAILELKTRARMVRVESYVLITYFEDMAIVYLWYIKTVNVERRVMIHAEICILYSIAKQQIVTV